MQNVNINITKAEIRSFNVSYDNERNPQLSVTLMLKTDGGKEITTYSISTSSWEPDSSKIDIPNHIYAILPGIEQCLEEVVAKHCEHSTQALEAPDSPDSEGQVEVEALKL